MTEIITSNTITPDQKALHGLRLVTHVTDLGHVKESDDFLNQLIANFSDEPVSPLVEAQVLAAKARSAAYLSDYEAARSAALRTVKLIGVPADSVSLRTFINSIMLLGDLEMINRKQSAAVEKYLVAVQAAVSSRFVVDGLQVLLAPIFALANVYFYIGEFAKGIAILSQAESTINHHSSQCGHERDLYLFRVFSLRSYGYSLLGPGTVSEDADLARCIYSRLKWSRPLDFSSELVAGLIHLGYYYFNTSQYDVASDMRRDALLIAEKEAGIDKSGAAKLYYDFGLSELFRLVHGTNSKPNKRKIEGLFREAVRYQAGEGLVQSQEYADYCFAYGVSCLVNGDGETALTHLYESAKIETRIWGSQSAITRPDYAALSMAYEMLGRTADAARMNAASSCRPKTRGCAGIAEDFGWRVHQKNRILNAVTQLVSQEHTPDRGDMLEK